MADDRFTAPPVEIAGQLGQLIDPGGGYVPGLPKPPLPGALGTATPGLATAAVAPVGLPSHGPDDPGALALMIERLAGELFGGAVPSSIAPVSLAPLAALSPANVQLPASPGMAPQAPLALPVDPPPLPGLSPSAVASLPGLSEVPVASLPGLSPGSLAHLEGGAGEPGALASAIERLASELFAPTTQPAIALPLTGQTDLAAVEAPWLSQPNQAVVAVPAVPNQPAVAAPAETNRAAPAALGSSPASLDGAAPAPSVPPLSLDGVIGEFPGAPVISAATPAQPADRPAIRNLGGGAFDPHAVRRDFPILDERIRGKRLVWLDNAATTQKPRAVIDRLTCFYEHENSNVHRGAHTLAARATDAYESGREATKRFLNAPSTSEIIFVRGATEGINLIAQSWGRRNVTAGDEIVVTHLEHHANIVPWQQLCAASGATLKVAPVDDRGDVILEAYERLLGPRTRLVALPQVSNALGTVTPAREMIEIAHRHGAVTVVDGAQAVSHMRVDVQQLDCDFYVFSGHKVFAPTGIGAVFGKRALLDVMPPWQGGGNMIQDVTFERTTYQLPPWRFEAGTASIADAAGLGAALDYVMRIGLDTIDRYEHELLGYAERGLATVPGLRMVGAPRSKAGVLSFVLDGQRTEDVGAALDQEGIAVRSGHHCAQPILRRFGHEATVRASLAFYNVCEDIDALVAALRRLQAGRG